MATNRTMEDWFLRGGERPEDEPTVGMAAVVCCQNCGGENLSTEEYCTHCGGPLFGEPSTAEYCGDDEDETGPEETTTYTATIRYWRKVRYETVVDIDATSPEEAERTAREIYDDVGYDDVEEIDSESTDDPVEVDVEEDNE